MAKLTTLNRLCSIKDLLRNVATRVALMSCEHVGSVANFRFLSFRFRLRVVKLFAPPNGFPWVPPFSRLLVSEIAFGFVFGVCLLVGVLMSTSVT